MSFELPDLPYAKDALEPTISARTLEFHHGKHHAGYVKKLNAAIKDKDYADMSLEDIILKSSSDGDQGIFNNAAQTWNHTFFWHSMAPDGGGQPKGALASAITKKFGSFEKFSEGFVDAGAGRFGSGWVWLVEEAGDLKIVTTLNAELPLTQNQKALLTCDVWEHAYYLDHQNDRGAFLKAFMEKLANWNFAARLYASGDGFTYADQEEYTRQAA